MIVVLAGTRDGRELTARLADDGRPVLASVVSEYGAALAGHAKVRVHVGALDEAGLLSLLQGNDASYIVDASHPYAAGVSANAMKAAVAAGIPYLRLERQETPLPDYARLYMAADAREAARLAASLGKTVFLTTGSRTLPVFKEEPALRNHRVIARVLPEPSVIEECIAAGFTPRDIVAMQGPFSLELNREMFRFYGADVIVTKNSGDIGGADSKVEAAIEMELPLIVIDRPRLNYPVVFHSVSQVLEYFKEAVPCSL